MRKKRRGVFLFVFGLGAVIQLLLLDMAGLRYIPNIWTQILDRPLDVWAWSWWRNTRWSEKSGSHPCTESFAARRLAGWDAPRMSASVEELPQAGKERDTKSEYERLTRWEKEGRTMSQEASEEEFWVPAWLELMGYQETETRAEDCLLGCAMLESLVTLLRGFSSRKGRKAWWK